LALWRNALREALGSNGRLIIDLVPELELIIGAQPPIADLPPQEIRRRFQSVSRRFVSVFAQPSHPLALFLDDLQWLDTATLDMVEDLLTHADVHHLMLIAAYPSESWRSVAISSDSRADHAAKAKLPPESKSVPPPANLPLKDLRFGLQDVQCARCRAENEAIGPEVEELYSSAPRGRERTLDDE
jgi:hypothetical protein